LLEISIRDNQGCAMEDYIEASIKDDHVKGILTLYVVYIILHILGFHVTQVSLIITQVKNKIAYHLINWVKKLKKS